MPLLKEAVLWSPLMFYPKEMEEYESFDYKQVSRFVQGELAWGVAYTKPRTQGFTNTIGKDYAAVRQMWWCVGDWRPDPELLGLFRQIRRREQGDKQVSMHWGDPFNGPGLVERGVFGDWESGQFHR